ncbi:MAG TPA: hypothetical protein VMT50_02685 [Steroidobacteraceae bacterium]|nr:hypothetical protein [Steroidobacteraceae bacterium]
MSADADRRLSTLDHLADDEHEMKLLLTRAAILEERRQSALAVSDLLVVTDLEAQLSRLWSRYLDLERTVA